MIKYDVNIALSCMNNQPQPLISKDNAIVQSEPVQGSVFKPYFQHQQILSTRSDINPNFTAPM